MFIFLFHLIGLFCLPPSLLGHMSSSKAAAPPGREQRERTALGLEMLWRLRVPRRLVLLRVPVGAVHTGTVSSASVREPEAPSGNDR